MIESSHQLVFFVFYRSGIVMISSSLLCAHRVSGEVRLWDMRQANSVQVCAPHHEMMTAMATHANAHLFAT